MDIRTLLQVCEFNCESCNSRSKLCKDVKYLNSKDKALTFKHNIYYNKRNYENTKAVEPDLIFELFVADNIDTSPQKILRAYNYNEDYTYSNAMAQKVNRIKRKVKSLHTISSNSYVEDYLLNTDMKSFSIAELDIYIDAIRFLYISKDFKLSLIKNPHKTIDITYNWFELSNFLKANPNMYRGNDIYFLASFCKGNKKKRNLCNRLFIDLGYKESFSYADLDYIIENIELTNYTIDDFFEHLNFIRQLKSK